MHQHHLAAGLYPDRWKLSFPGFLVGFRGKFLSREDRGVKVKRGGRRKKEGAKGRKGKGKRESRRDLFHHFWGDRRP